MHFNNPGESNQSEQFEGGCDCRAVRYRMTSRPMIVHCCHCRWCQRESGALFALNAISDQGLFSARTTGLIALDRGRLIRFCAVFMRILREKCLEKRMNTA
jgi:hypothetical protein